MTADDIKRMIEAGIPNAQVDVQGEDGTHFEAVVVSDAFEGKSRVQQHRLVYETLGDNMKSAIHALSMQTMTPQEWESQQNKA